MRDNFWRARQPGVAIRMKPAGRQLIISVLVDRVSERVIWGLLKDVQNVIPNVERYL